MNQNIPVSKKNRVMFYLFLILACMLFINLSTPVKAAEKYDKGKVQKLVKEGKKVVTWTEEQLNKFEEEVKKENAILVEKVKKAQTKVDELKKNCNRLQKNIDRLEKGKSKSKKTKAKIKKYQQDLLKKQKALNVADKALKTAEKTLDLGGKAVQKFIKWMQHQRSCMQSICDDMEYAMDMFEISNHNHPTNTALGKELQQKLNAAYTAIALDMTYYGAQLVYEFSMFGKGAAIKFVAKKSVTYIHKIIGKKAVAFINKQVKKYGMWLDAGISMVSTGNVLIKCEEVKECDKRLHVPQGTVVGFVHAAYTKKELVGAVATCGDVKANSNDAGFFYIDLAPGTYTLEVNYDGYEPAGPIQVTVESGKPTEVDIPMESKGILFGHYDQDNNPANGDEPIEWIVLKQDGSGITLISKYGLECLSYHTSYSECTWESCYLRSWLNGSFFNRAFTSKEKSKIQTVTVNAEANPKYDSHPGNSTLDKVYIPSLSEAKNLMSQKERECFSTYTAAAHGALERNCNWWLRTPGHKNVDAVYVQTHGEIWVWGIGVDGMGIANPQFCVRPVICIK